MSVITRSTSISAALAACCGEAGEAVFFFFPEAEWGRQSASGEAGVEREAGRPCSMVALDVPTWLLNSQAWFWGASAGTDAASQPMSLRQAAQQLD